ncbi:hypothetical protein O181_115117 [Austropuccinia psidii MF-1]|uniref:Endonuclease/exonuclease/phosphatase domain-containing protein n=1 Tax=Austropuccinia psidii MF-1 TaxID=1389203 RepID=A0A9Q3K8W2_9BASI|nr:hypothetical protein [Austropuccinia psidii MF-1]
MGKPPQLAPPNTPKLAQNHPYTQPKKPRTCIYINKQIPSHQIINHPQESNLLTTITLLGVYNSIPQLTLLSLYNPPTTFSAINILNQWLQTEATQQTPTLLVMASNLHHPHWNPSKYTHTHTQARNLIKICGKKGFHLILPRCIPTFLGAVGKPMMIDLIWANLKPTTQVQLNNHSSDHHLIITIMSQGLF